MVEYNKIETVFNRDTTGTKKLIRGNWRNEAVEYLKDSKWQFTEKFDGTNIRVIWDGHYIIKVSTLVSVASFGADCRRYIGYVVHELQKNNYKEAWRGARKTNV